MKKSITITLALLVALSFYSQAGTLLGSTEPAKMKVIAQESLSANATNNINIGTETTDVTKLANIAAIFGVEAIAINITGVNASGNEWIEILNQGTASGNLTGWSLHNQENLIYTFPVLLLDSGSKLWIHGGMGTDSKTDLYTNTTQPLVNNTTDLILLMDASGTVVGKYNFNSSATTNMPSNRSPEKLPMLVSGSSNGSSKNPDTASILLNGNSTKDPEKAPLLINGATGRDTEKAALLINDTSSRDPEKAPLLINTSNSGKA
jgi:hypothetical protein